jgi:hypothetical protein
MKEYDQGYNDALKVMQDYAKEWCDMCAGNTNSDVVYFVNLVAYSTYLHARHLRRLDDQKAIEGDAHSQRANRFTR